MNFGTIASHYIHTCMKLYMCVYIYMHTHMYIHMYMYTYMYTHMYMYIYLYTKINIYLHIYKYIYICIHTQRCTRSYIHTNWQKYTSLCILQYVYIFIYVCVHTCMHSYTSSRIWTQQPHTRATYKYTCIHIHIFHTYIWKHIRTCMYLGTAALHESADTSAEAIFEKYSVNSNCGECHSRACRYIDT